MNRIRRFSVSAYAIVLVVVVSILAWKYFLRDFLFPDVVIPSAAVSHQIFSACLNEDVRWLRTLVEVRNTGTAEIKLDKGKHDIAQVSPSNQFRETPKAQSELIEWPVIVSIRDTATDKLQAGARLSRTLEFLIDPSVRVIEVTSMYESIPQNDNEKSKTWRTNTIYELGDQECPQ